MATFDLESLLCFDYVQLAPPSWRKALARRNQDLTLWSLEEIRDLDRALPLHCSLRADLHCKFFWNWRSFRSWSLPWRSAYENDVEVIDVTCPLRLIWLFLFGRLQQRVTPDTVFSASQETFFTEERFQDLLDFGGKRWKQDVLRECQQVSGEGWYRLLLTPQGFDLVLSILPAALCEVLSLDGVPSLWSCQSGGLGSSTFGFLRREAYKEDPVVYCFHASRDQGPELRTRTGLAFLRRNPNMGTPGLTLRAFWVLHPWLRRTSTISRWALQILALQEDTGMPDKAQSEPRSEPQQPLVLRTESNLEPPLSTSSAFCKKPVEQVTESEKQETELRAFIDEQNKKASLERLAKRQELREQRPSSIPLHPPKRDEEPESSPVKASRKEKRSRQRRERQLRTAAAKQLESDADFLRQCRPALEASRRGPEEETRVQEDTLPEIERRLVRELRASARHDRKEQKLQRRLQQQLI